MGGRERVYILSCSNGDGGNAGPARLFGGVDYVSCGRGDLGGGEGVDVGQEGASHAVLVIQRDVDGKLALNGQRAQCECRG